MSISPWRIGAIDHAEHVERAEQLREQRVHQHHVADLKLALLQPQTV
jgi:hypothetical protein